MIDKDTIKQLRKMGVKVDLASENIDTYINKVWGLVPLGDVSLLDNQIIYGNKSKGVLVFIPNKLKDLEFLLKKIK